MNNIKNLSIYEFLDEVKRNPNKWINYCEIIILRSGLIIISNPSHTESVIAYAMKQEKITREELMNNIPKTCLPLEWIVDKYGLVAYWYSGYMESSKGLNKFQKHTINLLKVIFY